MDAYNFSITYTEKFPFIQNHYKIIMTGFNSWMEWTLANANQGRGRLGENMKKHEEKGGDGIAYGNKDLREIKWMHQ